MSSKRACPCAIIRRVFLKRQILAFFEQRSRGISIKPSLFGYFFDEKSDKSKEVCSSFK